MIQISQVNTLMHHNIISTRPARFTSLLSYRSSSGFRLFAYVDDLFLLKHINEHMNNTCYKDMSVIRCYKDQHNMAMNKKILIVYCSRVWGKIFYFERNPFCSIRLHLFDQKHSKNCNTLLQTKIDFKILTGLRVKANSTFIPVRQSWISIIIPGFSLT